jgi:hypothetical protein
MTRLVRALFLSLGLLASLSSVDISRAQSGSSSSAPAPSDAEITELKERVAAFWAARVAGDAETQWKLLEPRGRGRMTAQEYAQAPTGGRYLAYQVEDASVRGLFAMVKVKVLVQQILPISTGRSQPLAPHSVVVEDGWIRIGGTWYRSLDDGQKSATEAKQP